MEPVRIQKLLSEIGVCSRRKAEEMISQGRVKINGEIALTGAKASLDDEILVDDKSVNPGKEKTYVYLKVNKPLDVVTTLSDPQGRTTIADIIPSKYGRLFPVGRLDHNSTGLLIMTNDGEFANLVTHPSSSPEKEYWVKVKNPIRGDEIKRLAQGLYITREGYTALPAKATVLEDNDDSCKFSVIIHEGKKREVRHMMETLGHPVISLERVRIGSIELGDLPSGKCEPIDLDVINGLKAECADNKANPNR